MPTIEHDADLYEVILIESDEGYAVLCPGIPGAVSQGDDRANALKMIADAMAMCLLYPLPGEETVSRRAELRDQGRVRIAQLVAECQCDRLRYEVCHVAPKLINPQMLAPQWCHSILPTIADGQ